MIMSCTGGRITPTAPSHCTHKATMIYISYLGTTSIPPGPKYSTALWAGTKGYFLWTVIDRSCNPIQRLKMQLRCNRIQTVELCAACLHNCRLDCLVSSLVYSHLSPFWHCIFIFRGYHKAPSPLSSFESRLTPFRWLHSIFRTGKTIRRIENKMKATAVHLCILERRGVGFGVFSVYLSRSHLKKRFLISIGFFSWLNKGKK
jgi:hypothetical protein